MTQPANKTQATPFQLRLDMEVAKGRLTIQQAVTLGMVEAYLRSGGGDDTFAVELVKLLES